MRKVSFITLPVLWMRAWRHTQFHLLKFMLRVSGKVRIQAQQSGCRTWAVNIHTLLPLLGKSDIPGRKAEYKYRTASWFTEKPLTELITKEKKKKTWSALAQRVDPLELLI